MLLSLDVADFVELDQWQVICGCTQTLIKYDKKSEETKPRTVKLLLEILKDDLELEVYDPYEFDV